MLEIQHLVVAISRGTTFPFSLCLRVIHKFYIDSLSLMYVRFMRCVYIFGFVCVVRVGWCRVQLACGSGSAASDVDVGGV